MMRIDSKVLIKMPSSNIKIISLKDDAKISLGKFGTFSASSLVGMPFNAAYEILQSGDVAWVDETLVLADVDADDDADNNNSNLVDRSESQKLSQEEIEVLKKNALNGELDSKDLIKQLVENSESFEGKTAFAKQKYVRRKERKFSKKFQAFEPSALNLCEYYFESKPQKTLFLRHDTLCQLLCLANVMASSNILISDSTGGLVVGSVLERMSGIGGVDIGAGGKVFALLDGDSPNFDIVKDMNFDAGFIESTLDTLAWTRLEPPVNAEIPQPESDDPDILLRHTKRVAAIKKNNLSRSKLEPNAFDALILTSQYDPQEVLSKLFPFLGPSRPVVIYSQYKEQLIPVYLKMRASVDFVNAQLSETMTREYQVPVSGLGTHPFMTTTGGGGYLLYATKVDSAGIPAESLSAKGRPKNIQATKRRKL